MRMNVFIWLDLTPTSLLEYKFVVLKTVCECEDLFLSIYGSVQDNRLQPNSSSERYRVLSTMPAL